MALAQPISEVCNAFAKGRLEATLGRLVVLPVLQRLGEERLIGNAAGQGVGVFVAGDAHQLARAGIVSVLKL